MRQIDIFFANEKQKSEQNFELKCLPLTLTPIQNLKSLVKSRTLNASNSSGLISKRNFAFLPSQQLVNLHFVSLACFYLVKESFFLSKRRSF